MKSILFILFFLPAFAMAQDCKLIRDKDAMTGKPKVSTAMITFPDIQVSVEANNKEIDFFFLINIPKAKCVDENTTLTFVFEGGKMKSELRNSGSMNCDGIFHIIMKNSAYTPSALNRLNSKKIIALRLKDVNDKITSIELSPEDSDQLTQMLSCITREAKTVL